MRISAVTVVAVALVAATAGFASTTHKGDDLYKTYLIRVSGKKLLRPPSIQTKAAGEHSTWAGLRWSGWGTGRAVAVGHGTVCFAGGKCRMIARMTAVASDRFRTDCGVDIPMPLFVYRRLQVTFVDQGTRRVESGAGIYSDVCGG